MNSLAFLRNTRKKDLLSKISKYSFIINNFDSIDKTKYKKSKNYYEDLLKGHKQDYSDNRILPIIFYGERLRNGNRFFDFKNIDKGEIIFKYEKLNHKISLKFYVNKQKRTVLEKLKILAMNKEIPITVKLTKDKIDLSYEEGILTGKHFDIKKFYKEITHIKNKDKRKKLISDAYKKHEEKNFKEKVKTRYAASDINPRGLSYVIVDKISDSPEGKFKIIKKTYIDFEKLSVKNISSDKRKHEISIAIKKMFKDFEHHKVCHFVHEDINNLENNLNNKNVNRLINNVWNRNYIENLFTKWCNHYGLKQILINPVYSSFIGNILYNEYDPIAAAIEIVRRGIIKYIKGGKLLPSFHKRVITDISKIIEMDYNKLMNVSSWKETWKFISATKKSVRRVELNKFNYKGYLQNRTDKSMVKLLIFQ